MKSSQKIYEGKNTKYESNLTGEIEHKYPEDRVLLISYYIVYKLHV